MIDSIDYKFQLLLILNMENFGKWLAGIVITVCLTLSGMFFSSANHGYAQMNAYDVLTKRTDFNEAYDEVGREQIILQRDFYESYSRQYESWAYTSLVLSIVIFVLSSVYFFRDEIRLSLNSKF